MMHVWNHDWLIGKEARFLHVSEHGPDHTPEHHEAMRTGKIESMADVTEALATLDEKSGEVLSSMVFDSLADDGRAEMEEVQAISMRTLKTLSESGVDFSSAVIEQMPTTEEGMISLLTRSGLVSTEALMHAREKSRSEAPSKARSRTRVYPHGHIRKRYKRTGNRQGYTYFERYNETTDSWDPIADNADYPAKSIESYKAERNQLIAKREQERVVRESRQARNNQRLYYLRNTSEGLSKWGKIRDRERALHVLGQSGSSRAESVRLPSLFARRSINRPLTAPQKAFQIAYTTARPQFAALKTSPDRMRPNEPVDVRSLWKENIRKEFAENAEYYDYENYIEVGDGRIRIFATNEADTYLNQQPDMQYRVYDKETEMTRFTKSADEVVQITKSLIEGKDVPVDTKHIANSKEVRAMIHQLEEQMVGESTAKWYAGKFKLNMSQMNMAKHFVAERGEYTREGMAHYKTRRWPGSARAMLYREGSGEQPAIVYDESGREEMRFTYESPKELDAKFVRSIAYSAGLTSTYDSFKAEHSDLKDVQYIGHPESDTATVFAKNEYAHGVGQYWVIHENGETDGPYAFTGIDTLYADPESGSIALKVPEEERPKLFNRSKEILDEAGI